MGVFETAHDNAANRVAIREAGGIPPSRRCRSRGAADCQEAAVMALGNLAYNNPANQAAIVAAGAVGPLVALVRVGAIRLGGHSREAEWALKMLDLAAIASRLQTLPSRGGVAQAPARAPAAARRAGGGWRRLLRARAAVAFLPSGPPPACARRAATLGVSDLPLSK